MPAAETVLRHSAQPSIGLPPQQPSPAPDCVLAHSTHESLTNTREAPDTSAQHLPSISETTARQLASKLAASVIVPHASQEHSSSSSAPVTQGSASQLQGMYTRSSRWGDPLPQGYPKLLGSQEGSHEPSLPAGTDADVCKVALCPHEGSPEHPEVAHSPSPELAGETSELELAIQLSLSHEALPLDHSDQELQHSGDTGHAAEQPQLCMSASPSRQVSESSELNEAISLSLSSEFLPETEPESTSLSLTQSELHGSDSPPTAPPHSDPHPPLGQPSAASPLTSARESSHAGGHSVSSPSPHFGPTSASASGLSSSASVVDTLHQQEEESCTAGGPTVGTPTAETPAAGPHTAGNPTTPDGPTSSSSQAPESDSEEPEAAPNSPEHMMTDVQQAPNSPGQSQPQSAQESHISPAPTAPLPSSFQYTPPPAILTSPSPKPPDPSPGTAAQIDGDAALARQLQKLELEDESAADESSAPAQAPAEAVDDDVDLAALQDVEVPLVGDQLPLAALVEDYEGSPRVCGNLVPLLQRFPYFRRIRGWSGFNACMPACLLACLTVQSAGYHKLHALYAQGRGRDKQYP